MKRFLVLAIVFVACCPPAVALADRLPPSIYDCNAEFNRVVYGTVTIEPDAGQVERGRIEEVDIPAGSGWSIAGSQSEYYASRGRFWQGLPSHSIIPDVNYPLVPDRLDRHPGDQDFSWVDAGAVITEPVGVNITINTYDGPNGKGYVVVGRVFILGRLWRITRNFGPELWRESYWAPAPFTSPLVTP